MTCPICSAAPHATFRPFCSKRCADIDLGRWMTGAYAVPAEPFDPVDSVDPDDAHGHGDEPSRH